MLRLPGKHNNSIRYFYGGFVYHRDSRGAGLIFRCATRARTECPAVVYVQSLNNLEGQRPDVIGVHSDAADEFLYLREKFNIALKGAVTERATRDEPQIIFRDLLNNEERVFFNFLS